MSAREEEIRSVLEGYSDNSQLGYASITSRPDSRNQTLPCFEARTDEPSASRHYPLITVEVIVFLVSASFGGLGTIREQYIRYRIKDDQLNGTSPDRNSTCGTATDTIENDIQRKTSEMILCLTAAGAIPGLFFTLLLGTLSERFGRRLPILAPCVGYLLGSVVLILVVYLHLPLAVLFVGEVVAHCTGGFPVFLAGCFSYITDITTKKKRMIRMVVLEILIFAGIGSMVIGLGFAIRDLGFATSLWIPFAALFASVINAAAPCLLPESLTLKSTELRSVKDILNDTYRLISRKIGNRRSILASFAVLSLLSNMVSQGSLYITVLYGQGFPFCWRSVTIGYFVTWSLAVPGVGTVVGANSFQRCKVGYLGIIQISSFSTLANTLALALTFVVQSNVLIFSSTFLGLFKLLGLPVIRTYLSTVVEDHEHGALFASLGVLDGICLFLSPIMMTGIYAATVDILSTTVFFVMSALMIIPIIITWVLQWKGICYQRPARPRPRLINGRINESHGEIRSLLQ